MIGDKTFLWRYGMGAIRPFTLNSRPFIEAGYLVRGTTIRELAEKLGIDAEGLERTIAAFNDDARTGRDREFGRGDDEFSRYLGDMASQPNPCLAPIVEPPFFAIELVPSDLGTVAGLRTNTDAMVLTPEGGTVPNLYAAGGDMRSIMCGRYPGPGITLGPALTFGYLAAMDAARS
jgi:succinate dehydrogenase/fumarate reductase flavoprotein subunit